MNENELQKLEEENALLKNRIRNLGREIAQRERTISAMESNFNIKMNMFRALAVENEKHYRYLMHLMKSSADFIILLDKELNVAYCSDLFLKKIKVEYFTEVEGKDIFDVYAKLNDKELLKLLKENLYLVLNRNNTCRHDILYDIEGKGEKRTFRITNTPIINEETKESNGIIIIWSDTADITIEKNENENEKEKLEELSSAENDVLFTIPGIDVERGIKMTGDTVEGYKFVLSVFCMDIEKRLPIIKKIPSLEELPNYKIEIHAIKGATAAVGARGLSEEALRLTEAAEKHDINYIKNRVHSFTNRLESMVTDIQKILL